MNQIFCIELVTKKEHLRVLPYCLDVTRRAQTCQKLPKLVSG